MKEWNKDTRLYQKMSANVSFCLRAHTELLLKLFIAVIVGINRIQLYENLNHGIVSKFYGLNYRWTMKIIRIGRTHSYKTLQNVSRTIPC